MVQLRKYSLVVMGANQDIKMYLVSFFFGGGIDRCYMMTHLFNGML